MKSGVNEPGPDHLSHSLAKDGNGEIPEGLREVLNVLLEELDQDVPFVPDMPNRVFKAHKRGEAVLEFLSEHGLHARISAVSQCLGETDNGGSADPRPMGQTGGGQENDILIVFYKYT